MRPVTRDEILSLEDFAAERPAHHAQMMRAKQLRRLALGPNMTLLFENRVTVRWQIHEMCRVERIQAEAAIEHEIESYNTLVPGESELSATLMIEYAEEDERKRMLTALLGLKDHLRLDIEGVPSVPGRFDEGREDPEAHRVSAVHFVRFQLDDAQRSAFMDLARAASFEIDHPAYTASAPIPAPVRGALVEDLLAD